MSFEDLTLGQATAAIRKGNLSPVEYVEALVSRIHTLEPQLRAWVTVDENGALEQARACETEAQSRNFRGPLHGIPVGIKDIFRTQGLRTTAGSRFLQEYVPNYDADSVKRLKAAGAIILGKTVTTEFANYDPGPSRNPWNPAHTPGGSSSGSAVAVAARMCPAATGTQTVGSIARPAAYCGVVGFMPTQRRVSRGGVFPVSWTLDHIGGFTQCVADARILFEALGGDSLPQIQLGKPVRVGVLRGYFSEKASSETRDLHERFLKQLDSSSFTLEEVHLPEIFSIQSAVLRTIMRAELASGHGEFYSTHSTAYGSKLRALIETGKLLSATDYLRALRLRKRYQAEMERLFEHVDLLIAPGAMDTAPEGLHYTGDPGFSGPWSLADFPTISLPQAIASNRLPVAVQICAPPMQEALLFSAAELLENTIGFRGLGT